MFLEQPFSNFLGKPVRKLLPHANFDFSAYVPNVVKFKMEDWKLDLLPYLAAGQVESLAIGEYNLEYSHDLDHFYSFLAGNQHCFTGVKNLFLGTTVTTWNGPRYLEHGRLPIFLNGFENLEYLKIRGSCLSMEGLKLNKLRTLIQQSVNGETHGLNQMQLPELEHFEFWTGENSITSEGILGELKFPKLQYLGICNSYTADDDVDILQEFRFYDQLEVLDLSYGNMTDEGGEKLLALKFPKNLKKLILIFHYLTPRMQELLKALPFEVVIDRCMIGEDGEVEEDNWERPVYYCEETIDVE